MNYLFILLLFQFQGQIKRDSITGTWRGTSICQVKSSPCNNEIAVYHITSLPGGKTYHFIMNKVVTGKEEDMAVMDFAYNDTLKTLKAFNNGRVKAVWKFVLNGSVMHGTLTTDDNTLYRVIDLHKD